MLPTLYSKANPVPKLLVVLTQVSEEELEGGQFLVSPSNEFLLDYLAGCEFGWAITALELEDPKIKMGSKQVRDRQEALWECVAETGPTVVLALGKPAVEAMWPAEKGRCPSIAKARTLATEMGPGRWLCCSYDPRQHHIFLTTDGRNGSDLSEEYLRVFHMAAQLVAGTYQQPDMTYTTVDSTEGVGWLERRMLEVGVTQVSIDIEDTCWWGSSLKPHEWSDDTPERLTMWHADTEILCLGLSFMSPVLGGKPKVETYVIAQRVLDSLTCTRLLRGRTLIGWNLNYEAQGLHRYLGYDVYDPDNGHQLVDLMFRAGLPDQSKTGIGLKPTIQTHLSAPVWDLKVREEMEKAKVLRGKQGGVPVACLADVPQDVMHQYNGYDTYWPLRVYHEYYIPNLDGGLPPDSRAYAFLHRAMPFFAAMEREGLLIDQDWLNDSLDTLEGKLEQLEAVVTELPEVQEATTAYTAAYPTKTEFNVRSPLCFEALVKITHAAEFETLERTPKSKQLCRGKDVMATLAGNDPQTFEPVIPVEQKTRGQLVWSHILHIKETLDYLQKFYTILNYTSSRDSRIHTAFRLVRADVASEDVTDGADKGGGTVSGRTSSTPNVQNVQNDPVILGCYIAPPGCLIVELDYGRAELVWLGFNTQDSLFRQWALEGKDQHLQKGAVLWAIRHQQALEAYWEQPDEVKALWRPRGKTQNFAEVYMQEPETTAFKIGCTVGEAIETARLSAEAHPAVQQAKIDLYNQCQNGELIRTSLLGRARSAEGWKRRSQTAEEFLSLEEEQRNRRDKRNLTIFRSLWNTKAAQADANDTTEWQGVRIYERLQSRDWLNPDWVRPCNFVHDSLRFYIREDYVEEAVPELAAMMEDLSSLPETPLGKFDLPLLVECKLGPRGNQIEQYDWREYAKQRA